MIGQIVDVEGPIRDWLISQLGGVKVYLGDAPPSKTPVPTWVIPVRIGGGPDLTAASLDMPLMSFHCYGRTRKLASDTAHTLANLITVDNVDRPPINIGPLTILYARVTLGPLWQPDVDAYKDIPRYVVDVTMTVRAN